MEIVESGRVHQHRRAYVGSIAELVCRMDGTTFAPFKNRKCACCSVVRKGLVCRRIVAADGFGVKGRRRIERRAMSSCPTVITAFDDRDEAQLAVDELEQAG